MWIYKVVVWFTNCPYFNLIASTCSILSFFGIYLILKIPKPKSTLDKSTVNSIVEKILMLSQTNQIEWLPCGTSDVESIQGYKKLDINLANSFSSFLGDGSVEAFLIDTNSCILLFITADFLSSAPRFICNSNTFPTLDKIIKIANPNKNLSDEDYLKQIFMKL